ncbi:hypothetical protein Leryth_002897 [Lithospermum erythrorhizon]|nr:hypothetical protein Leryth_002897 [Lithospermum erythrorhizon]
MEALSKTPSMLHLESNNMELNNLTNEIFSILENKFLFGFDDPKFCATQQHEFFTLPPLGKYVNNNGKVRILSIDSSGSTDGVLAAKSLAHLEATLRLKSHNPNAHIVDFFDIVAGSGVGGVLAAMLFTKGTNGNPLFTAEMALKFITENSRKMSTSSTGGFFRRPNKAAKMFKKMFKELTLKDTIKGALIPCYDNSKGVPFVFSRADALEMDGCDFKMSDVCGATIGDRAVEIKSVDGRTKIMAVGGGVVMSNPTAAAITHVVNNKHEFPLCKGVEDLLVVSLGNGEANAATGNFQCSTKSLVKIAGIGAADMVDQAISMAFGKSSNCDKYVRIQGNNELINETNKAIADEKKDLLKISEGMLKQRNVESILFQGKKISQSSNMDKLVTFASELINEQERRKNSILPPVVLKQAPSPRTSSATTLSSLSSSC